jgi:hypothetical protein
MRRPPCPDDADGMVIALLDFSPDIQDNRRRMNFAEYTRILRRFGRNDTRPELPNALQLRRQIDLRFPINDLFRDVRPDSIDLAQLIALRLQHILRRTENLQEFAQPHRPH